MIRGFIGTVVGVAVAFAVLLGVEIVGHFLYPPPAALQTAMQQGDSAAMRRAAAEYFPRAPLMALVLIPVAWVAGVFWGTLTATAITRGRTYIPAIVIGGLIMAGTVANVLMIPHPLWIAISGLAGIPAAALAAWWLWPKPQAGSGPQPYDMREKNRAC